jgi:membrane protease YdiL (CAAX protease family)
VNIYPVLQLPAVIAEEVFFRSYLYSELAPLLASCWKVNIASSFVFALAHVVAYRSVLMFKVFLPSLLMGWLYQKRRTIAPPVLFHWLANTAYLLFPCGV